MAYKPNIPSIKDVLKKSLVDFKENFEELDTVFDIDHVKYSDATGDRGKHKFARLANLTEKKLNSPGTGDGQYALYVKDVPTEDGTPRLFYRKPNTSTEVQISNNIITGDEPLTSGEAPLFGGMSIKWGTFARTADVITVSYEGKDVGLTNFKTTTFVVLATQLTGELTQSSMSNLNEKGFTNTEIFSGGSRASLSWVAIGI